MSAKRSLAQEFQAIAVTLTEQPAIASRSVEDVRAMWETYIVGDPEQLHSVADLSVPGAVGPLKSADLPHGFLPFFPISQVASDALDEIAAAARLLLQRDKST